MPADKIALREASLAWRKQLHAARRADADEQIATRVVVQLKALRARSVGVYWPIRGEADLSAAWHRLRDQGVSLALPAVEMRDSVLRFRIWSGDRPTQVDACGVPTSHGPHAGPLDAIVVPCLGFDPRGYRLGYGGGYFDRTLAGLEPKPYTLGVAYDDQQCGFEAEEHDVRLDAIATERRLLEFR